jgi:hypothetical protein
MTQGMSISLQQSAIPLTLLTLSILPMQVGHLSTGEDKNKDESGKAEGMANSVCRSGEVC